MDIFGHVYLNLWSTTYWLHAWHGTNWGVLQRRLSVYLSIIKSLQLLITLVWLMAKSSVIDPSASNFLELIQRSTILAPLVPFNSLLFSVGNNLSQNHVQPWRQLPWPWPWCKWWSRATCRLEPHRAKNMVKKCIIHEPTMRYRFCFCKNFHSLEIIDKQTYMHA